MASRILKSVRACPYCGKAMDPSLKAGHPKSPTRDHVVPKSRGGRWWIVVCRRCNNDKADMDLHEWHDRLRQKNDPRMDCVEAFIKRLWRKATC